MTDLINKTKSLEDAADNSEKVLQLIDTYKEVLKNEPENYHALWKIGNYFLLMGDAYATGRAEKRSYFKQAENFCEKAMLTNTELRTTLGPDGNLWEKSNLLTMNELDAMGYWYTARFYYFKEGLNYFQKLFNLHLVLNSNPIIDRINQLQPDWAGGGNYFSKGIYCIAAPKKYGGGKENATKQFEKAIEVGPDWIVNRWGRAKYLYGRFPDDAKKREDLEWVVAQNPHSGGNTYPWNVFFIREAKEMLSKMGG